MPPGVQITQQVSGFFTIEQMSLPGYSNIPGCSNSTGRSNAVPCTFSSRVWLIGVGLTRVRANRSVYKKLLLLY